MSKQLENQLFNLKFTAKQLNRMSIKASKNEKAEMAKVKKCIEKGNTDGARIHAQNAIREKNQSMNYLRLGSRVDAVSSRLESAMKMQAVTKSMGGVVKGMDKALKSMNIEQISKVMEQFEKSFEEMDVRSEYVEQAMNSSTATSTPEDQVEGLMQQVADEHGLDFKAKLGDMATGDAPVAATTEDQEDELAERLRKLRANA